MDNRILRFRHCGRSIYMFSDPDPNADPNPDPDPDPDPDPADPRMRGPARCPVCREPMSFGLVEAPTLISSPFNNGHKVTCAFLIGSQLGPTFISEQSSAELHVGISNSSGVVFSYTESGVQSQTQGWEQCLTVPLVAPDNHTSELFTNHTALQETHRTTSVPFRTYWDSQLEMFASLNTWTAESFLEEREFGSCCYGFALGFINHMRRLEGREPVLPDTFTIQHILPRITTSSKYLLLYQHIRQQGYYSPVSTLQSEASPGN